MITSLTIPQPYVASVVEIKRKSIKISWKSPFLPTANDKTKFGSNVTICVKELITLMKIKIAVFIILSVIPQI